MNSLGIRFVNEKMTRRPLAPISAPQSVGKRPTWAPCGSYHHRPARGVKLPAAPPTELSLALIGNPPLQTNTSGSGTFFSLFSSLYDTPALQIHL